MRPYLVRWHEQYGKRGLTIIEVNQGKQETRQIVRASVLKQKVPYPVLWDKENRNTIRYGVTAWPVAYLIDVDGNVVWEGSPARVINRKKTAQRLRQKLETILERVKKPGPAVTD